MLDEIKNKIMNDRGLIRSLFVHSILFLVSLVSVSKCSLKHQSEEVFVTVDMLPIIDKSNVDNSSTASQKKNKPINDKPKPEPKVEEEKKEEKKTDPKPKDEPKLKKDNPDSIKKLDKKEKTIKEDKKDKDKKNNAKNKDKPKTKQSIDDLIDKLAEDENPEKTSKTTSKGKFDPNSQLGLSAIDSIKQQIRNKWLGPKNRETIITIKLDIKGELIGEPQISSSSDLNDPLFVAVAQAAKKAIMRATPFKDLPVDKYEAWKELKFIFLAQD